MEETAWTVLDGDCLAHLAELPDESADALVTDPPGAIKFMNKSWDGDRGGRAQWVEYMRERFEQCLRVLKPGGHGLVWAMPRTAHWTMLALEDAGFEVRDVIVHLFGSGMPHGLNVSKAIDEAAGAEREATAAAKQWDGWNTELKPASEHWILVRKPIPGRIVDNVLEHGTGAINIDATRIGMVDRAAYEAKRHSFASSAGKITAGWKNSSPYPSPEEMIASSAGGRWPANVTLDEEAARLLDEQSSPRMHGAGNAREAIREADKTGMFPFPGDGNRYGDEGGASRFFMVVGSRCGDESTEVANTSAGRREGSSDDSSLTDGSGNKQMGQSRQGMKSTTSTSIPSTTTSKISGASPSSGTTTTTPGSEKITKTSAESSTGDASDAANIERSISSESGKQEPTKVTAPSVPVPISENGESGTESTTTPITASIDGPDPQARFYYTAKARPSERIAGLDGKNKHPTVKSVDLMRWLARLVTPLNGLVIDPFCGSGSTGVACVLEGFRFLGMELEAPSAEDARTRIAFWELHGDQAPELDKKSKAMVKQAEEAGQLGLFK